MKVITIKDADILGMSDVKEIQLYVEGKVEIHQNADGFIQIKEIKADL